MKLRTWWFMTATTYSCLVLAYAAAALLGFENRPPLNAATLLQSFVLTSAIALAQLLWDWLDLTPRICHSPRWQIPADALFRCLICVVLVLGVGMPIGLIPVYWESVWAVLPILIPTFLAIYTITYLNFRHTQKDADFINDKINSHK